MTAHELHVTHNEEDDYLLATGTVLPQKMQRLLIGEYETEELIPMFTVEDDSGDSNGIKWIESQKVMEDGTIRLSLLVQNFTPQPVTVQVHREDQDD